MDVFDTLKAVGERVQICWIVGSVPRDGSGDIRILYANTAAATLFGYASGRIMEGEDVRKLMPDSIAGNHRMIVRDYVDRANGGTTRISSIMGSWRYLDAVRTDGTTIPVAANVADVRNSEERYFIAIFKDRRDEVRREQELSAALADARESEAKAEQLKSQAEEARRNAEEGLLKQKRLSGQITLLRQIFGGTVGLVVMMGALLTAQWATGISDPDGLAMVERVLLVLTGILGSAMASVFDSRNRVD